MPQQACTFPEFPKRLLRKTGTVECNPHQELKSWLQMCSIQPTAASFHLSTTYFLLNKNSCFLSVAKYMVGIPVQVQWQQSLYVVIKYKHKSHTKRPACMRNGKATNTFHSFLSSALLGQQSLLTLPVFTQCKGKLAPPQQPRFNNRKTSHRIQPPHTCSRSKRSLVFSEKYLKRATWRIWEISVWEPHPLAGPMDSSWHLRIMA